MGFFDFLTTAANEAIDVVPTISDERAEEALESISKMDTRGLSERLDNGDINDEFLDDLVDTLTAFDDTIKIIMCDSEYEEE